MSYCNKWTITTQQAFINQRTRNVKSFEAETIECVLQGLTNDKTHAVIRGNYPNEDYFSTVPLANLKPLASNTTTQFRVFLKTEE